MYFCEVWITLLIFTCWIFSLLASFRASITQIYLTALQKQTWLISWESKTWWFFFFKGLSSLFYPSQPNGGLFGTGHPLMIITFIIYEQSLFFSELKMFLLRRFPPFSFGPICTAWDLRLDFRCAFYSLLFFFFPSKEVSSAENLQQLLRPFTRSTFTGSSSTKERKNRSDYL